MVEVKAKGRVSMMIPGAIRLVGTYIATRRRDLRRAILEVDFNIGAWRKAKEALPDAGRSRFEVEIVSSNERDIPEQ